MKTGTTSLQNLLESNRNRLSSAGFCFPGRTWSDQGQAARNVLFSDSAEVGVKGAQGSWSAMAEQMLRHEGRGSIFSMEFLSFADRAQAARVVGSLDGAEVQVILTVRDARRAIPAQWQTSCRNAGTVPWPRFLRGVRESLTAEGSPRSPAARLFQRTQGIPRMLDVWAPLVGPDRLHVVTVPGRGSPPRLLWERFASVIGVDPEVCVDPPGYSNVSLGHASTEFLRLLNVEVGDLSRQDYQRVVKGPLARVILEARSELEGPVRLHRAGTAVAAEWNRQVRSAILDSGAQVVGSLSDLPVGDPDPDAPPRLERPAPADLLAAAATARDGLTLLREHLRAKASTQRGAAPGPTRRPSTLTAPTTLDHWAGEGDPVGAAVAEVGLLVRGCVERLHEADERRGTRVGAPQLLAQTRRLAPAVGAPTRSG